MTLTKAIKIARDRVYLMKWGHGQWSVDEWSPRHNATIQGQFTDRWRATAQAKEARIRLALEQLGFEDIDAGATANDLAQDQGSWEVVLRHYWKHRA